MKTIKFREKITNDTNDKKHPLQYGWLVHCCSAPSLIPPWLIKRLNNKRTAKKHGIQENSALLSIICHLHCFSFASQTWMRNYNSSLKSVLRKTKPENTYNRSALLYLQNSMRVWSNLPSGRSKDFYKYVSRKIRKM